MDKSSGVSVLHSFPKGEHAVSMTVHNGTLYVATNWRIYRLGANGKLYSVPLAKE